MKKMKLLMTLFALTILVHCKKHNARVEHEPIPCHLVDLSEEYHPVCGCDGITYQNAGYAQCVGGITKYRDGECD